MIEIVGHIQSNYVPLTVTEKSATIASTGEEVPLTKTRCHQVLLGGDQLTVARARSAIRSVGNSDSSSQKLSGVMPVVEDLHVKLTLLSVSPILLANKLL